MAWGRRPMMAARHSSAPAGEPGRLTSTARPLIPAMPRDSGAIGLERRMASARPGAGRSTTSAVPSGVRSLGLKPVPPVVATRPVKPDANRVSSPATAATPSEMVDLLDYLEARVLEGLDHRRTAGVFTLAPHDRVRHREHFRLVAHGRHPGSSELPIAVLIGVVAASGISRSAATGSSWPNLPSSAKAQVFRRSARTYIPSVPAVCGSSNAPRPSGSQGGPGGGTTSAQPVDSAFGQPRVDVDGLRPGQGAHAVHEHAAGHHQGAAADSRRRWRVAKRSASSGRTRQRASGRRRSTPRPVQGASTSTPAKVDG